MWVKYESHRNIASYYIYSNPKCDFTFTAKFHRKCTAQFERLDDLHLTNKSKVALRLTTVLIALNPFEKLLLFFLKICPYFCYVHFPPRKKVSIELTATVMLLLDVTSQKWKKVISSIRSVSLCFSARWFSLQSPIKPHGCHFTPFHSWTCTTR